MSAAGPSRQSQSHPRPIPWPDPAEHAEDPQDQGCGKSVMAGHAMLQLRKPPEEILLPTTGGHVGTSSYHACRALADWDPEPGWSYGTPKCKRSTTAADDPNIENKRCYCYQYGQTDAQSFTVLRSGVYNNAGNKRMQNTCWSKRNGSIICENPH